MEEELPDKLTGVASESDDEDEIIGSKRPVGKRKMIIDDDEDDDDDAIDDDRTESDAIDAQSSHQENENKETSDDDEDGNQSKNDKGIENGDDDETAETDKSDDDDGPLRLQFDDTDKGDSGPLQLSFKDKDIFDAESDDEGPLHLDFKDADGGDDEENQKSSSQKDGVDKESSSDEGEGGEDEGSDNDEGFGEDGLDPELLAKLKKLKGASKSTKERAKYERKSKPSADQMLELHSESQKLKRDCRINLPYYEPAEKTLDDFLARANKKKQEYSQLRRATDMQKAQIIAEKLAVTPPKLTPSRRSRKSAVGDTPISTLSQPCTSIVDSAQDSGLVSQDLSQSQDHPASQSSNVVLQASVDAGRPPQGLNCVDDDDELPDLCVETIPATTLLSNLGANNTACKNIDNLHSQQINTEETQMESEATINPNTVCSVKEPTDTEGVPSLKKDPSRDLFSSQSTIAHDGETQLTTIPVSQPSTFDPLSLTSVINETPESVIATPHISSAVVGEYNSDAVTVNEADCTHNKDNCQTLASNDMCDVKSNAQTLTSPTVNVSLCSGDESQTGIVYTSPTHKDKRKNILDKLQKQGLALPPVPKLAAGTPTGMICLDDIEEEATPKNPGLLNLMNRLARHSQKRPAKAARDVDISIIEKESSEGGQQELKLKSVKYHIQPEEEYVPSDGSPGSKLSKLKQQLSIGMKKKREEARQRRIQLYNMDNEEGFERAKEDDLDEEEEAEMTDDDEDRSSSDEDEEELRLGDNRVDMDDDDGEDYNPLLDTEAQDEGDDDNFNEDSDDFHLEFEGSDDDENNEEEEEEADLTSLKKKKNRAAVVSDDDGEEGNENESVSEKQNKKQVDYDDEGSESLWSNDLTPMSRHLEDSQPMGQTKYRRQSSCSPDLYATAPIADEDVFSPGQNSNNDSSSQNYFNPQSQMLDADGYLKLTQTQRPPKSRISMLAQSPTDDSGGFSSSLSIGQIFNGVASQVSKKNNDDDDENMRELMGLCSGKFKTDADEDSLPSSQTRLKSTQSFDARALFEESDGDIYDPFKIMSEDDNAQDFGSLKKKSVLSDSEDDGDDTDKENKNASDDEDDEQEQEGEEADTLKFTSFKDKKRIRRAFFEDEAELSGSEFDSDENVDLAEEDDILEEEEGDKDTAGMSESKLRKQVGRLHMKQILDDDDRQIMRYKEMYLQDGDLYTDGRGRRRNFRWKDIDNSSQQDMFNNASEEEEVEEDHADAEWRKDRYEREKFLEESEKHTDEGDSQLVKLGQGFLQKKDSFSLPSQELLASPKEPKAAPAQKKFKMPQSKGSFLTRSKDALVKIAKMARSAIGGNVKNSRGFVFQVEEKAAEEELPNVTLASKRKAHTPSQPEQIAKKQKLNSSNEPGQKPSLKKKGSILNHLQ